MHGVISTVCAPQSQMNTQTEILSKTQTRMRVKLKNKYWWKYDKIKLTRTWKVWLKWSAAEYIEILLIS